MHAPIARLMARCRAFGFRFAVAGGDLVVDYPAGAMTPQRRATLRRHKAAIIAEIAGPELVPGPRPRLWVAPDLDDAERAMQALIHDTSCPPPRRTHHDDRADAPTGPAGLEEGHDRGVPFGPE